MGTTGGGVFKTINAGQSVGARHRQVFRRNHRRHRESRRRRPTSFTSAAASIRFAATSRTATASGRRPTAERRGHSSDSATRGRSPTSSFIPTNPDLVYVGVLGHIWAPNPERGVFRSKDGGKTWEKILFKNDSTGVVDLVMDPNNPNVLYAGLWQAGRTPWMLSSGGTGSGLWKTTDGGDHWTEITRNPGLPAGIWGNIGIAVSGANSNRLWANIEADSGGVFRSNDGGQTWTQTNTDRNLRQRAWYYTKIYADPKDTNVVYDSNVSFMKSVDGGKTFRPVRGCRTATRTTCGSIPRTRIA